MSFAPIREDGRAAYVITQPRTFQRHPGENLVTPNKRIVWMTIEEAAAARNRSRRAGLVRRAKVEDLQ
jgi:hypothetical protein